MKYFEFNYSKKFNCIADKCTHNCCIGWDINIDKSSLKKYQALARSDSRFEKAIQDNLFNLDGDYRCLFLDNDNLCHLIKNYGENSLCKTCKTHPRFKNFFSDRVETGLGLYCEEACRIILTAKNKMKLVKVKESKTSRKLTTFERKVLSFRNKIIKILQDRSLTITNRVNLLESTSDISLDKLSFVDWKNEFCSLEKLKINNFSFKDIPNATSFSDINEDFSNEFEQLLCYLTFKHISRAIDILDLRIRLIFIILCFKMINHIFSLSKEKNISNLIEIVRFFTSEVECSEDNLLALLNKIELLVSYK
jgi:lysine-N-methylase